MFIAGTKRTRSKDGSFEGDRYSHSDEIVSIMQRITQRMHRESNKDDRFFSKPWSAQKAVGAEQRRLTIELLI
jgi:hypothetical protein